MNKKRKHNPDSTSQQKHDRVILRCVVHNERVPNNDPFTSFNSLKCTPAEKLSCLHDIRDKRLCEPLESPYRMKEICDFLPDNLDGLNLASTGYHRRCYQDFTRNLHRLKSPCDDNSSEPSTSKMHHSPRKRVSLDGAQTIFPVDECIFCDKKEIKVDGCTQRPTLSFSSWKGKASGWQKIESMAEELGMGNIHRKVKGVDLFAAEAHFHDACYHRFYSSYQKTHNKGEPNLEHSHYTAAHNSAYTGVKDFIKTQVIDKQQVVPLSVLRDKYISELDASGEQNPSYRSIKIKSRLEKDPEVGSSVSFTKVEIKDRGCLSFWLIYSTNVTVEDAIACAYKLGTADHLKDTAQYLRQTILKAFRETKKIPWPPTADELEQRAAKEVPVELKEFLNMVLSENGSVVEETGKTQRLVYSIGEDICRAVTNGQWKLSKHMLLCTTIRHLYRSKQLTMILNRLGHCESYDFGLELETAVAKALDEDSTYLTPNIICGAGNAVFHSEWDNLNKVTTNIHGSNVVNSAGGIMIQEIEPDVTSRNVRTLPLYDRSKNRSLGLDMPEILPPVTIYNREGPRFPKDAVFAPPDRRQLSTSLQEYYAWLLCRLISSDGKQEVPGQAGFVSATGVKPFRQSTINYYTPINQPITQYETVQELLRRSACATREVGQKYTINTFDLGVCMKALPLIWKFPQRFKNHVILPGAFHTSMNYIGMITNHKCRGSGYAEILLEAQLVTSGCLKSVLSGHAYAKGLFCLKTVCEALERLLLEVFIEEMDIQISTTALLNLVASCTRQSLTEVLQDYSTVGIIQQYIDYQDKVREGYLGKTATFWMSVIDHQRLVLMLNNAVKTNNLELFHVCNGKMANLFFAFDGPNYSRYLSWFEVFLSNLELTHPGAKAFVKSGAIAVARSLVPGSLCAVDRTMEETFMKSAKCSGGLSGIFQRFGAYHRWCRTTSARAQYLEKLSEICDMVDDSESHKAGKHRDLETANIKKSEEAVRRTVSTIRNFLNPFTIPVSENSSDDRLYALHSGAPVPQEVEVDVMRADALGEQEKFNFVEERLKNDEKGFFDPIKRKTLKTMDNASKKITLTTSQGKLIQYQEQSNLAFTLLVKSQLLDVPLDLDVLMCHSLSPVPHCLGTQDGFFAKTNKAAMMHYVLEDTAGEVEYPQESFFIQDGNALFHSMRNLPPTFGDMCLQILDQMAAKINFIFSTDSYETDSIKAHERRRRGCGEKYIVEGPATRIPKDFKVFLANEANKMQFCELLLKVWRSSKAESRLRECRTAMIVIDGKAYQISSINGEINIKEVHSLRSNQEETDTRIILYLHFAEQQGFKSAVVRTPDSDILFILLVHAHKLTLTIFLDIGTGKHRRLLNVSGLADELGKEWCLSLLGFYVFTGEDCTSAFKGRGKVVPLRKLEKNPKFHDAFRKLGEIWEVAPDLVDTLEVFTCMMYGQTCETSVNKVRSKLLKKMVGEDQTLNSKSKVDLVRLPPCKDSLIPHIQRVNHRVACYKRASEAIFDRPKPFEESQGWLKTEDGIIEPVWSVGPIFPSSVIELLDMDSDSPEDDTEIELDEEQFLYDSDDSD